MLWKWAFAWPGIFEPAANLTARPSFGIALESGAEVDFVLKTTLGEANTRWRMP